MTLRVGKKCSIINEYLPFTFDHEECFTWCNSKSANASRFCSDGKKALCCVAAIVGELSADAEQNRMSGTSWGKTSARLREKTHITSLRGDKSVRETKKALKIMIQEFHKEIRNIKCKLQYDGVALAGSLTD